MLHVSPGRAAERRLHANSSSFLPVLPVMILFLTALVPAIAASGLRTPASFPSSNMPPAAALMSASNQMLMKSGAILKDVFSAPRLLDAGTAISLKCTATGTPLPQVTWTLDGNSLHESTSRLSVGDFVTKSSEVISFVNMTAVTTEDGGVYSCTAANEVSSASHSGRIDVRGDPTVRSMREKVAVEGAPLLLSCPFSGHPIDEVFWEHSKLPARYLSLATSSYSYTLCRPLISFRLFCRCSALHAHCSSFLSTISFACGMAEFTSTCFQENRKEHSRRASQMEI